MTRMLLFGAGYTGSRIADALEARDWEVTRIGRATSAKDVDTALARATHILSTAPPSADGGSRAVDPLLACHGTAIGSSGAWLGYISSTGVYGDTGGAWVDESAPLLGRRPDRIAADRAWLAMGARVLRLPGIYGPGRSALDRVAAGQAHRVDLPDQVFSRIHVDDIVGAALAAIDRAPAGAYNIADDLPASQNDVVSEAASLLGCPAPPLLPLNHIGLSPAARAFYAENRRAANGKARRLFGWSPAHSDYHAGLRALMAMTRPTTTNTPPKTACTDQR